MHTAHKIEKHFVALVRFNLISYNFLKEGHYNILFKSVYLKSHVYKVLSWYSEHF